MTHFIKLTLLSLISISLPSCAKPQPTNEEHNLDSQQHKAVSKLHADDTKTRTGLIDADELISHYPKFKKSYDEFEPEAKDVKNIRLLNDMDVVVFFGLWCHDSQREVPRLLKLIEQSGNPFNSVKLVALNTKKELTEEYASQFEVKYTPTIFVVKDGQTLAKIIESPKGTITQDLIGQIFH